MLAKNRKICYNIKLRTKYKGKFMKRIIRIIFFCFIFCLLSFGLTACAHVEKKGMSTDFKVVSCTYDSNANTTKIVWNSTLTNESIYDMEQVYFRFDLYKNGSFVRTTDNVYWNIQIAHGQSNCGNRSFTVEGEIDNAAIHNWNADFANLWDSYEGWWIGTIIGVAFLSICLIITAIKEDGDISSVIEDNSWIFYLLIPLLMVVGVSSVANWLAINWVTVCIVVGGL